MCIGMPDTKTDFNDAINVYMKSTKVLMMYEITNFKSFCNFGFVKNDKQQFQKHIFIT